MQQLATCKNTKKHQSHKNITKEGVKSFRGALRAFKIGQHGVHGGTLAPPAGILCENESTAKGGHQKVKKSVRFGVALCTDVANWQCSLIWLVVRQIGGHHNRIDIVFAECGRFLDKTVFFQRGTLHRCWDEFLFAE